MKHRIPTVAVALGMWFTGLTSIAQTQVIFQDGFENEFVPWSSVAGCISATDPRCQKNCSSNDQCGADEYCNSASLCVPDEANGEPCSDGGACMSGYCSSGYCCAAGDCCAADSDCGTYDFPAVCDDGTTCQGSRLEGVCSAQNECQSLPAEDDSACAGTEANTCGPYPSVFCTSDQVQSSPECATSCVTDADCDGGTHCDSGVCEVDLPVGAFCDEPSDCQASLFCTDNVCCTTACDGGCEACDLPGLAGICALVPDGTDPDGECGGLSCASYFWGWASDTCYQRADVSDSQATCDGTGLCDTAASECVLSNQGPAWLTCDALCQDPVPGTCTGSTAGFCSNLNLGNQTCGNGVCEVTAPVCVNGSPFICVPDSGAAGPEACNDLDDNCDGTVDNGSFGDPEEPNNSCASYTELNTVGSDKTITYTNLTLYPDNDADYYLIPAIETDSSCSCCDFFCLDEDFRLTITLTVPQGAGSYLFCTGDSCGSVDQNCVEVVAGQFDTWIWTLDGGCPGNDSYERFIRVTGDNFPGFECAPYTLQYTFEPGCF